jgi:hypothetical protein
LGKGTCVLMGPVNGWVFGFCKLNCGDDGKRILRKKHDPYSTSHMASRRTRTGMVDRVKIS